MAEENYVPEHRAEEPRRDYPLSNSTYDALKAFVEIVLPGAGTLYFALAAFWGWPKAEEVVGSLAAVAVFLGLVLRTASKKYQESDARVAGFLDVTKDEESGFTIPKGLYEIDPLQLEKKDEVVLKVRKD